MKARALLALGVASCLAIAGCSSDSNRTGDNAKSVSIGFLDSLTGPVAACGQRELKGAQLAIKTAKAEDLLPGVKISLDQVDDASTAEGATVGYKKLHDDGVAAVVGLCYSLTATTIASLIDRSKLPTLVTAGAKDLADPSFGYRSVATPATYAESVLDVLAERGVKTISVIYQQESVAVVQLWNDVLRPHADELGIKVLKATALPSSTQDISAQIAEFKADRPDAIGLFLVGAANVSFPVQIRSAGLDVPVFGYNAMQSPTFASDLGDAANEIFYATNFAPEYPAAPAATDFVAAYTKEYSETPNFAAAHGYDSMLRLLTAISMAKSFSRGDVKAALDQLHSLDGAQGKLTFTDDGDATSQSTIVVELQNGALRRVR